MQMPRTEVVFYAEDGKAPVREWLRTLPVKAQIKCLAYLSQLEIRGHELRRPVADLLREGIYELRPSYAGVHYRILYFFAGKDVVVIAHGLIKEAAVPAADIGRALLRRKKFEANPKAHAMGTER
jgi:phage-related protein